MPLSGGEEREEDEPAAEKERAREEEESSGANVRSIACDNGRVAARKFHVSVAAGEGQRSMMLATETVMEEEALEWLMLVLLQEEVEEEL